MGAVLRLQRLFREHSSRLPLLVRERFKKRLEEKLTRRLAVKFPVQYNFIIEKSETALIGIKILLLTLLNTRN